MNLKQKILLTISLMIFGSLILMLTVGGSVIRAFSNQILPSQQMIDSNVLSVEKVLNQFRPDPWSWSEMGTSLQELGYALVVSENGQVVYDATASEESDSRAGQLEVLPLLQGFEWKEHEAQVYTTQGVTVVGVKSGPYTVLAILHNSGQWIEGRQILMEGIFFPFLIFGLVSIGLILLAAQIVTHYLAKRIMKPINALEEGARRISHGDLSLPVEYDGKETEFATVCNAFNQMQTHLNEEQEKNAAFERTRTDMIRGISHDLRTPLTSMKGYIKGLMDGVARTPERQEQYLSIAYRKACDMDVLLQKFFYFSKMETGKLPLRLEWTDMGAFVLRFFQRVDEELKQKRITTDLWAVQDGCMAWVDEEQMYRVLTNLTENALKYAEAQGLKLTVAVWQEEQRVHLTFADNGKGVEPEKLTHIFEQFWRGDEARSSRNEKGSGLGLYIVKYIVEAHQGLVWAENDRGLKVHIVLQERGNSDEGTDSRR